MSSSKKANRPDKRVLVRWSDDLDKQVLLTIQWACNEQGLRIPWEKVAEKMGDKFSEGAIIQHLAKLRQKMEANNIPVPPPLKRGTAIAPSKIYATGNKRKAPAMTSPNAPATRRQTKSKSRRARGASDDEGSSPGLEPDELSDGEYGAPRKMRRLSGKRARKVNRHPSAEIAEDEDMSAESLARKVEIPEQKVKEEHVEDSIEAPDRAVNTRGVLRNDAKSDQGGDVDDDDEEEEEDDDVEDGPNQASLIKAATASTDREISPLTKVVKLPVRIPTGMGSRRASDVLEETTTTQSTIRPSNENAIASYLTGQTIAPNPYQMPSPHGLYLPPHHSASFSTDRNDSMSSRASHMSQVGLPSLHDFNSGFHTNAPWLSVSNGNFDNAYESFSDLIEGSGGDNNIFGYEF